MPHSGAVRQLTDPVVPALSLRINPAQAAPIQPLLLPWSLRPDLEELGRRKSTFSPSIIGQRKGSYQKPLKSPGFVTPSPHVPVPTVTNEPNLSAPTRVQGSPEPCLVSGASLPRWTQTHNGNEERYKKCQPQLLFQFSLSWHFREKFANASYLSSPRIWTLMANELPRQMASLRGDTEGSCRRWKLPVGILQWQG